jgi:hypothetical protein
MHATKTPVATAILKMPSGSLNLLPPPLPPSGAMEMAAKVEEMRNASDTANKSVLVGK